MDNKTVQIHKIGVILVDTFHYLALLGIGAMIVWSAIQDYIAMMKAGHASLEEIVLLFIYLELWAIVSTYFKTRRLPVQFLIFIAITALSRHLVIDVQDVADSFQLYLLLITTIAIVLLCVAILILSYAAKHYGCPEDNEFK